MMKANLNVFCGWLGQQGQGNQVWLTASRKRWIRWVGWGRLFGLIVDKLSERRER